MIIGIDIDDTVLDYSAAVKASSEEWPQSKAGFYYSVISVEEAIHSVHLLAKNNRVVFVTAHSDLRNVLSLPSKLNRVKGLFPDIDIIICDDKSMIKLDILIDDKHHDIEGRLLDVKKGWPWVMAQLSGVWE